MADIRGMEGTSMRIRTHAIHIDSREIMSVTGVKDVESFNEQEIFLVTDLGNLHIEGMNLHITKLNLDDGQVMIEGEIIALEYEAPEAPRQSMFSRLFR